MFFEIASSSGEDTCVEIILVGWCEEWAIPKISQARSADDCMAKVRH